MKSKHSDPEMTEHKTMKLISWNVNGIRSALKKGFLDFVSREAPDVLCLQETKINHSPFQNELPAYEQFWNHAQKAGYAGTAVLTRSYPKASESLSFPNASVGNPDDPLIRPPTKTFGGDSFGISSRIKPLNVSNGIGMPKHDDEGRVITLEFKDFFLVNVYVPNSKRDLTRLGYRTQEWDVDFLKYLKKLETKKPVIFCGDMNVAHQEIDLTYPKANVKNHGFTPQERAGFDAIVNAGFIDTFREFNKSGGCYTWWSQMGGCRGKNIGWRIDYFGISKSLRPRLKEAFILKDVMGSDHCPAGIVLK